MKTETGTVKFFNEEKGFGFITVAGSGQEVFVHKSALSDTIRQNDEVEFTIENGQKGPNAREVRVV
jgi:CspA family cold shock protein